jgi:hypothetical protein
LTSSKRSLPSNRYLSNSKIDFERNPNNLFSLKSEISSLKTELSQIKPQFESIQSEFTKFKIHSNSIELLHHLRSECNNQNPHDAGLVNITASSFNDQSNLPQNVLNFTSNNYWHSKNEPNQWILFDLKNKSFKMKQIRIHINYFYIGQTWTLEASNDNSNWTTIHTQGKMNDAKLHTVFSVTISILNNLFGFSKLFNEAKITMATIALYSIQLNL